MALTIKDRVRETTTTTGTGTITLAGAPTGFRSFADIGDANTTYYTIAGQGTNDWEVGLGTYTASGTTLSRDTVLSNSLGTTAKIDFSAGTKDVFCTYPSEKAILGDTSAVSSTGTGSVVLSDSPTITGNVNIGVSQYGNAGISTLINNGVQNNNFGKSVEVINNIGKETDENFLGSETIFRGRVTFQSSAYSSWDNCAIQMPLSVTGSLTVSGVLTATNSLQLTGLASANQSIATAQTTGSLTIGGANATGTTTIGQSTATHTFNIANGTLTTLRVRTINIGVAGASNSLTNTTIGTTGVQGSVRSVTLVNGTIRQQTFTVAGLPTGVAGARSFVTDALAPLFGMTVASGGSVGVPVYHDGTSWKVG